MSAFLFDVVIRGSAVLALAVIAERGLRWWGSASVRHFVWALTMAALLALPVATFALPGWLIEIPIASPAPTVALPLAGPAPATTPLTAALPGSGPVTSPAAPAPRRPFDPIAFAFAFYSAGVVLLLVRLIGEQLALVRLARRSRPVQNSDWLALVETAARQMGIRRSVHLLESDDAVMPFTFGTRRPTIVIPAAAAAWSDERRRAVIVHELAHVARADCLTQRLAALACALYWPHPGVWWGARRLRIEREHACDDRVLAMGTAPREYADHLLEIAHAFRGTPAPATALGMARARQLENRLLALLDTARNRVDLNRRGRVLTIAASIAVLIPVATLRAEIVHRASNDARTVSGTDTVALGTPATVQRRDRSADRFTTDDFSGTWELRPAREPGMVQVNLRTAHSSNGTTLPLSRFEGLNEPGMTAAVRDGRIVDGTVHFASRRDAGTFTFDGVCRNQMCGGTYVFAPDPAFASRLAKYGIGAPTASEQYELAMEDVGVDYLEGLKGEGYAVPDVHALVRAVEHGVSLGYVRTMAGLGYKLGTLDPLIRMRDHGVDPTYVKGMADSGFPKLAADDLVRLRDHGVDPEFVKGMRGLGFGSATLDDLLKARDHGIDPTFVHDMADAGYGHLSMTDLLRARDHGADPAYARALGALGYRSLPLDTLIGARDHGIDPQYVGGLEALGYKNLTLDTLIRARDHGVDPDYAGGMAALGYKDLPIESLIRMRDHGVDPAYVRQLQRRGIDHPSVDELIRRRDHGEDDPAAAARAALVLFRSYDHSLLDSLRS